MLQLLGPAAGVRAEVVLKKAEPLTIRSCQPPILLEPGKSIFFEHLRPLIGVISGCISIA
jgi:hypothetical protein